MSNTGIQENSKQNRTTIRTILLAGYSFAGYNIGSGFATGLEGQQFFAAWGFPIRFCAAIGGTFLSYSGVSKTMFTINGCLGMLLGVVILIRTASGYRTAVGVCQRDRRSRR